jgi:hypothetical protein
MGIQNQHTLRYVVERDVDLVFIQLIQTSSQFRGWFLEQLGVDETANEFIGISHSVVRETGESDVEIGLESADGNQRIILVENKINAEKQERQVERYFERGKSYVENDTWDEFIVCLIAPKHYIGGSDRRSFDTVVTYDAMLDQTKELSHDGTAFFREAFERGIEKRSSADHSELTAAIRDQFLDKSERLPDVGFLSVSKTLVKVKSNHPKHPSSVLYQVYLPGEHDGRMAIVRVQILGEASEEEQKAIRSVLDNNIDGLEAYRLMDRIMDTVRKDIYADEHSDDGYIETVVSELCGLIEFYHPLLIKETNADN